MRRVSTTKMLAKGHVVIPAAVRKRMGLKAGSQFVVIGVGDVVILKAIFPPAMGEFEALIAEARRERGRAREVRSELRRAVRRRLR